jgi:hypothetical protein
LSNELVEHHGSRMHAASRLTVILLVLALGVAGMLWAQGNLLAAHSTAPLPASSGVHKGGGPIGPRTHHAIKTVFVIVMENHNASNIIGNPAAPYINSTLLPKASYATQYNNPPGIHPSLPNYLWLEGGTNFGITDDGDPSTHSLSTGAHLTHLLGRAGISWKAYQEGIDGTTCPLTSAYPYAAKHNPFVYFNDVTNTNNPQSATCIAHERPYQELSTDLRRNTTARYSFITPNLCHDMHDACAPSFDQVKQGDAWLAQAVPPILNSPAYKAGGALFIVWDEAESGDGPIPLLVLSPFAKGHGYQGSVPYTHSSLLRTLEEIFGVSPMLGDAAHATSLRDLFTTYP